MSKLEKAIEDLVDVTVAHVMDNAVGTFRNMEDKKLQRRIAEQFISKVYRKCNKYVHEYFTNQDKNGKV